MSGSTEIIINSKVAFNLTVQLTIHFHSLKININKKMLEIKIIKF